MLTKEFCYGLKNEDVAPFMEHYMNLQHIKISCWGKPDGDTLEYMPGCHTVSYAYEKAFGAKAVHGRKFHVGTTTQLFMANYFYHKVQSYVHSWNVLVLPSGTEVLLDLFPNETCSLAPIILPNPHSAYKTGNAAITNTVEDAMKSPMSLAMIDFFTNEFLRITQNT